MLVALTSCGSSGECDLFSLTNIKTKTTVTLGMSRAEIENALNDTLIKSTYGKFESIGGLTVGFRDDKAVMFVLYSENATDFQTANGISVTSSNTDFKAKYKTAIVIGDSPTVF